MSCAPSSTAIRRNRAAPTRCRRIVQGKCRRRLTAWGNRHCFVRVTPCERHPTRGTYAMRYVLPLTISATAVALLAACNAYGEPPPANAQAAAASGGRQCIYADNISGYRRGEGDTIVINTNSRDYYQFRTQPYCADRI